MADANDVQRRLGLPPMRRHAEDDITTLERWNRDARDADTEGIRPFSNPAGFVAFRMKRHGWFGGPNDGADRYPEHRPSRVES